MQDIIVCDNENPDVIKSLTKLKLIQSIAYLTAGAINGVLALLAMCLTSNHGDWAIGLSYTFAGFSIFLYIKWTFTLKDLPQEDTP